MNSTIVSAALSFRTVLAAAVITMTITSAASAQTVAWDPAKNRVSPEEFAILPWGTTPGDPATLQGIYECGFNLAGFVAPEHLDMVAAAQLKAMVIEPSIHIHGAIESLSADEITSRVKAVADRTSTHPATFGYYLRDEPHSSSFPSLAIARAALAAAAPNALAYINLFPNYAQVGTYEDYVTTFIETVKPNLLSYDHYAMMHGGTLRGGYFQNLETFRAASLKSGLPFWNIVLSNAHFTYAEPSPTTFRFQAYTTLAYGARGISYFTYFTPSIGNYRLGPIDQFGHRTPTWEMQRDINLQMHALAPIYTKLKSVNTFHHPQVPDQCRGLDSSKFVKEITGGQFLVGEFEDPDGKPYLMVVNTDLQQSFMYDVAPKTPAPIDMINAYTGQRQPWAGENKWLAPGQGMLLALGGK